MEASLTFKSEEYRCEPCSLRQGTAVRELVRMIPYSVKVFDGLVGDEYFCCPICFDPKFSVKGRKPVKEGSRIKRILAGEDPNEKRTIPVLVKD